MKAYLRYGTFQIFFSNRQGSGTFKERNVVRKASTAFLPWKFTFTVRVFDKKLEAYPCITALPHFVSKQSQFISCSFASLRGFMWFILSIFCAGCNHYFSTRQIFSRVRSVKNEARKQAPDLKAMSSIIRWRRQPFAGKKRARGHNALFKTTIKLMRFKICSTRVSSPHRETLNFLVTRVKSVVFILILSRPRKQQIPSRPRRKDQFRKVTRKTNFPSNPITTSPRGF